MSATQSYTEHIDSYRIVLFAARGEKLLVVPEKGKLRLPTLQAMRHRRLAENLTASLKTAWSQNAVCLFRITPPPTTSGVRYQVMEAQGDNAVPKSGSRWVPVSSLKRHQLEDPADYAAIEQSVAWKGRNQAPFTRLGWFSELMAWAGEIAVHAGLQLTGEFSQLNASPTFSLVRLETSGPALWFKAVGEPNLHEYPVTLALTKSFPVFLPRVLAARADWNAWLALEAEGVHPGADSPAETWIAIARNFAELQIASLGRGLHLIDIGCRDARPCSLQESVDPFVEVMAELMEQQSVEPPHRLSRPQLRELAAQLNDLLETFARLDLPAALGHLDFNPSNIVTNGTGCVFLDWAEACCGPAFLTLQYLLEHVSRLTANDPSLTARIVSAYLERWSAFIDPTTALAAFDASRALAVFAYAICATGWRDRERRLTEGAYLRSLTRRLKRECDGLQAGTRGMRAPSPLTLEKARS